MATVTEYFEKGFPKTMTFTNEIPLTRSDGSQIKILVNNHMDLAAHAIFNSVLLPDLPESDLVAICTAIIKQPDVLRRVSMGVGDQLTLPPVKGVSYGIGLADGQVTLNFTLKADDVTIPASSLRITGRLYIYSPRDISQETEKYLVENGFANKLFLSVRGPRYAAKMDEEKIPKAFIIHDHRDKTEIARPVATKLQELNCPVWYDEFSLQIGDSLREGIEKGLKTCKFCILVLTPNFLSKGGWVKREYDMAFTKEIVENSRVLIPIWNNVTTNDVYAYSPILADRVGVPWSLGLDEVCNKINHAILLNEGQYDSYDQ